MAKRAFTLIELLIVIAILAILALVVFLVINPFQLFAQARDSNRLSDMTALNIAVERYQSTVGGSMGATSTVYVSIPDPEATSTAGDQCQGLGLFSLPAGWTYHCAASSTYLKTDGTGWIPVDFNNLSLGSPFNTLPVDPANQTSTGYYYTYTTNGTQYELTTLPESTKQRTAIQDSPMVNDYPGVVAMGTSLSLSPLYNPAGLNGYWNLNEGTGTTAMDTTGNGNTGTLIAPYPTWASGKIKDGLSFDGTTSQYVDVGNAPDLNFDSNQSFSIVAWIDVLPGDINYLPFFSKRSTTGSMQGFALFANTGQNRVIVILTDPIGGYTQGIQVESPYNSLIPGGWHEVVVTYDGSSSAAGISIYIDGINQLPITIWSNNLQGSILNSSDMTIGRDLTTGTLFGGALDDVRVYGRVLSPAEVLALYNAER